MRTPLSSLALVATLSMPAAAAGQAQANCLPAVSPDDRRIAFVGTRDGTDGLFVIDSDGSNLHPVAAGGTDGRMPRWNAAGELLFTGAGADTGTVFAVNPDGGAPRLVARVPGRSPVLSPDGTQVLYLVGPWTSTALVVADVDGSRVRQLAGGKTTAWNGAWAPDGTQIAYTYGDSSRVLQVHIVGSDGSGDRAVTHNSPVQGSAQMPAWSPDGRRLAVQVNAHATHSAGIWIVDLTSGDIRLLTPPQDSVLNETPAWFPGGSRLAFQSDRTGSMEIWLVDADGSNPRQVTGR